MPSTLVFAPTSRLLGVGLSSGTVQIWDLRLESQPALVREFGDPHSNMYSLAFSPGEQVLIGTSGDDRIWGWSIDQEAAGLLFSLDGAIGRPWDARFVEGGARFATSGSSGGVKVWHADESTATALLCSRRGDAITPEEWQRYLPGIDVHDPC